MLCYFKRTRWKILAISHMAMMVGLSNQICPADDARYAIVRRAHRSSMYDSSLGSWEEVIINFSQAWTPLNNRIVDCSSTESSTEISRSTRRIPKIGTRSRDDNNVKGTKASLLDEQRISSFPTISMTEEHATGTGASGISWSWLYRFLSDICLNRLCLWEASSTELFESFRYWVKWGGEAFTMQYRKGDGGLVSRSSGDWKHP